MFLSFPFSLLSPLSRINKHNLKEKIKKSAKSHKSTDCPQQLETLAKPMECITTSGRPGLPMSCPGHCWTKGFGAAAPRHPTVFGITPQEHGGSFAEGIFQNHLSESIKLLCLVAL